MEEVVLKSGQVRRGVRGTKHSDGVVRVKVPRNNGRTVWRNLPSKWVKEIRKLPDHHTT